MGKMTEKEAALEIIKIVADVIKEMRNIPSGHLYAQIMEFIPLSQYVCIIELLKSRVEVKNHLISWKGDKNEIPT